MTYTIVLCFIVCLYMSFTTALQCTSPRSKVLKFSVNSRRNATGHWVAQVQLQHDANSKETGPWEVEVDHTTARCEDNESIFIVTTVSAPPARPAAPRGYDLVPGLGYYKLHTDTKTWHGALKTCGAEGAHLAIINSEDEAQALSVFWDANPKILDGGANNWAHIGFHDQYKEGEYLTIFNESLVAAGYAKWHPGEPDGIGHNCGIVVRRINLLADIPCEAKQPYFCEYEL